MTHTNHYGGDGDSPTWTDEGASRWTRNVVGLDGNVAAIQDGQTGTTLQLPNLHGDVAGTAAYNGTALSTYTDYTEYGSPETVGTSQRYGWLGGKERAGDAYGGVILMGVRLYSPATGRFLQTDPEPGGSANAYDYSGQDPINNVDLDGRHFESLGNDIRCAKLLAEIVFLNNKVGRRARQLIENHHMWGADDEERIGHVKALKNDQQGLRNRLDKYNSCGCGGPGGGGLPKGVWSRASMQAPAINARTVGMVAAGAAGAGLLWWVGKLASPLCGPGVVACAIIL